MNREPPLPIEAWVENRFLYDLDPAFAGRTRCELLAVSSYVGDAPAFQILTADGAMFSYIPAHALFRRPEGPDAPYGLGELVYYNCETEPIDVFRLGRLAVSTPLAFIKAHQAWHAAEYLFSVDFPSGDDVVHALWLDNGQLAVLPSHKINFNGDRALPPYRRLTATWRV